MREIKFRGQRIDSKEWVYGDLIQKLERTYILVDESNSVIKNKRNLSFMPGSLNAVRSVSNCQMIETIPESVGQYIGLNGKNKKEIYERDIVEAKYYVRKKDGKSLDYKYMVYGEVIYHISGYAIKNTKDGIIYLFDQGSLKWDLGDYRRIGNTYDNPELLKGDK